MLGALPLGGQNIEIIKPKELEFPQESHAVRRKSWCQPEGTLASLEEMSQGSECLPSYFAGKAGAEAKGDSDHAFTRMAHLMLLCKTEPQVLRS